MSAAPGIGIDLAAFISRVPIRHRDPDRSLQGLRTHLDGCPLGWQPLSVRIRSRMFECMPPRRVEYSRTSQDGTRRVPTTSRRPVSGLTNPVDSA